MAKPSGLEDIAKTAPQEKKEEKQKQLSTLESFANEALTATKNVAAIGAEVAFPFMFSGDMRTNAMVNAYPLSVGARVDDIMAKKPVNHVKAAKESFVGTIITPGIVGLFNYIEKGRQYFTSYAGAVPGGAAAVAGLAAGQAVFVGAYTGLNHIVQNFSFKGLYGKLKKDYWPSLKNTWKYVLIPSSLNVLYLYKFGMAVQLAYSSLMSFLFRLAVKAKDAKFGNLVKAMNPVHYISAAANVTKKAAKSFYGIGEAAYAIGTGLGEKLYKGAQKAAAPATAPAT